MSLLNPTAPRFADILEYHLNLRLQEFVKHSLNNSSMVEMYEIIKHTVDEVFSKSSQNISDNTRSWIAQQFYLSIKISDSQIITDDFDTYKHGVAKVFDAIEISKLPTNELRLIGGLFSESTFATDILKEIRNR
jgi:hypothetical protein